ncbi:MAG: HlyC/CorC family transporter [Planctomycetaceae bacterium]|nr:MAG: HlyC/CorC family transporter [Planctomycetaceae bacterium]
MTSDEFFNFLNTHWLQMILLPILLVCSAFFSATETSLFNLTRAQLLRLSQGTRGGRIAAYLMRRPRQILNTLLLCNLLVNVAYTGISAVIILNLGKFDLGGWLAAVSLVPLLALILLGEVTPKTVALLTGERLATLAAGPLLLIEKILRPVLWGMDKFLVLPMTRLIAPRPAGNADISADELASLLDLSARRGVINLETNVLLQEIVSLTDIRVGDIMVPRVDMIACEVTSPPEEVAATFRKSRLRRLPVYEGDIDHILGIVHAKRFLLSSGTALCELLAKVPFVPEAANAEKVLTLFRVTRTQMAVVVDEYGGTAGLVTLEDVLEQIVGDIPSPGDVERPPVERLSESEYLVDAALGIHEWGDVFGTDLQARRVSTVGGFVTSLLGRIPQVGQTVAYRNLRFTILTMAGRRIGRMKLELLTGEAKI